MEMRMKGERRKGEREEEKEKERERAGKRGKVGEREGEWTREKKEELKCWRGDLENSTGLVYHHTVI